MYYNSSWTPEGLIRDLKTIAATLDQKPILILTKDEPVLWVSEFRKEIDALYEIYLPSHDIVTLLMNKQKFSALSAREGWPTPLTWTINSKDELLLLLNDLPYPCILKPHIKNSTFRQHAPKKAFVASNAHDLTAAYDLVARWEKQVLIQEWIPGGDERIAFCLTYYARNGTRIASFPGRKLRQWPIRCGNTAIAEPAPETWREGLITLTDNIWKRLGFTGIGSIEYKIRLDSNTPVIIEPTVGRTNWQSEVAVLNGENIPAIAYFDLAKQHYARPISPSHPVKLIDGNAEIRAALAYWRTGELSLMQWIADRSGNKAYMLLRPRDLGPFLASVKSFVFNIIHRLIRRFLRLLTSPLRMYSFVKAAFSWRELR
jgi:predicted ATP-grasp superfamily ATP-dependent carboligase